MPPKKGTKRQRTAVEDDDDTAPAVQHELKKATAEATRVDVETHDEDRYSVDSRGHMDISDDVFIFTGFRDAQLEHDIRHAGGAVATSMNSSVTVVITKDGNQDTNKVKAARARGIDVVCKEEFEANTGFTGKYIPDFLPILAFQRKQAAARLKASASTTESVSGAKRGRADVSEPDVEAAAGAGMRPASPSDAPIHIEGEVFVFTGFRDKALESKIKKRGGMVMPHMTKEVTVVISKDGMQNTNKARAALDRGLRLVSREEFEQMHNLASA